MTTPSVWATCEEIAALMRASSDVGAMRRIFDRQSRHDGVDAPYGRAVEHYLAAMGMLRSRPLLFGLYAPQLPLVDMPSPQFPDLLTIDGFPEFVLRAQRTAGALLSLMEFLRSRLTGYPDLPVPNVRPQAPGVDMDGLFDQGSMPWPLAARTRGFEQHGPPPAGLHGIDEAAWSEVAARLLERVGDTEPWTEFASAAAALATEDLGQLQEACRRFDDRTHPEEIHQHAGAQLMRQAQYRRAALAEAREPLSGKARVYLNAFDAVNGLLDHVGFLTSELAIHGRLVPVPADADVSWERTDSGLMVRARFAEGASPFLKPGQLLAYSGEPAISGAWMCHTITMGFHRDLGAVLDLTAAVLPGSETLAEPAES